ncbi:hypothetical protein ACFPN2_09375 [Steroidobacter flavus]|uniref:PrcB C-terminal domain-containing protein n=1 Tax=Steroidobacter flavus TaxID=1842136 RepID=A0ABV8SNU7_9GAMM
MDTLAPGDNVRTVDFTSAPPRDGTSYATSMVIGVAALLCALVACSAAPSPTIRFDSVMSGYALEFTDSIEQVLVLEDAAAYQNWGQQLRGYFEPAELPRIDFDERLVVVAYLGVRGSTTGLSKPAALLIENDQLVLEVNEPAPGPRCVQLQQEQIPLVAVSIARADYRPPVQVRVHKVTISC